MQVINLGENQSILNKFISELRDVSIQSDRMRFRRNIERIGEVLGYELSKSLSYKKVDITTPLGVSPCNIPEDDVVI
ncbi:MAG TPA: hypothetical protein VK833_06765, partial [Gillisia sp.]|nr:hypothetical protein [Gillisia sp.]